MHALLGLATLLLTVLATCLALGALPRVGDWSRRRAIQMTLLAAPLLSLGLVGLGLHAIGGRPCLLDRPSWSCAPELLAPAVMGSVALGGLGLGLARLALLARVVVGRGRPAGPALEARVAALAAQLGISPPRLLVRASDRPLAFTCGMRRPTVVLSTWLAECLDARELEAVLAHELGHIARHDYPVIWLALVLRDAFPYLPTSWLVHHQLQFEKELACDDLAVGLTRRPLALASALTKVWQRTVDGPGLDLAQPLVERSAAIEARIHRLLGQTAPPVAAPTSRLMAIIVAVVSLAGWLVLEAPTLAVALERTGCGPAALLGGLV